MSLPTCTVNTNNIQKLPDAPSLPSDELKQEFDKSGRELKGYINDILLPAIENLINSEKSSLEQKINTETTALENRVNNKINSAITDSEDGIFETLNLDTTIANKIKANNEKNYPVGTILINVSGTSPSSYLGVGSWQKWGQGRVPVGVASYAGDSDFGRVEQTGGERDHILTIEEMPYHRHGGQHGDYGTSSGTYGVMANSNGGGSAVYTDYAGANFSHNNLQPYITCYMWKRVS